MMPKHLDKHRQYCERSEDADRVYFITNFLSLLKQISSVICYLWVIVFSTGYKKYILVVCQVTIKSVILHYLLVCEDAEYLQYVGTELCGSCFGTSKLLKLNDYISLFLPSQYT